MLIIDDEPDIGAILKYIAEDCGYEASATLSADEFKAAYKNFKPTAVVVDLALPNTDGIELFRWLADQGCTLPILILSGFDDKVLESAKLLGEARGLRICGTVTKPMDIKGVRGMLEAL
ncbi:MAG TPA: response regulator [Alphaproteobacteria bacterium]|nr:response regulator [Alphaproteobacteria bacterium]